MFCTQVQGQTHTNDELNCAYPVMDKQMNVKLCLPHDNFTVEKSTNYFTVVPKNRDSTALMDVFFMVKVDDFKEKLDANWYRDEQLKRYRSNAKMEIRTLKKGNQVIDGKEFADVEMVITIADKKMYSRTLFYFEGTIGYLLDAVGSYADMNEISKSEILSLFQTFKIVGVPN